MISSGRLCNLDCDVVPESDSSCSSCSPDVDQGRESLPVQQKSSQKVKDDAKDNKKSKKKKKQIVMNVSDTKYEVVKYVGKEIFQWRLVHEPEGKWDVFWTDSAVNPETLAKMRPYQKINHFPGMFSLARKNHLARYLTKMQKAFPESYNFFPKTFLLPSEYSEFRLRLSQRSETYIVKPEASCQGRGIFLTKTCENIQPWEHYVVQKYIDKPCLVDGLKFDLRVYALLAGCDPLRIYIFNDGLARFATEPYVPANGKNLNDMCMHLTNYAVNKHNPKFVFNTSEEENNQGHKRSLKALFKTLEQQGKDVKTLWKEIKKIIVKTFCSVQPILTQYYRACQADDFYNNMCFEILGFDIMLDETMKPWLIEVNHTPSFTTDTPLDRNIKMSVIRDTLNLMNISLAAKKKHKKERTINMKKRVMTGKFSRMTLEERQKETEKAQKERDNWESQNLGGFEKIYPVDDASEQSENFDDYTKEANRWWGEWIGTTIRRAEKKETQPNKLPPMTFGRRTSPAKQGNGLKLRMESKSISLNAQKMSFESEITPQDDKSLVPGDPKVILSSDRSGYGDGKKQVQKTVVSFIQDVDNSDFIQFLDKEVEAVERKERGRTDDYNREKYISSKRIRNSEGVPQTENSEERTEPVSQDRKEEELEENQDQRRQKYHFFRIKSGLANGIFAEQSYRLYGNTIKEPRETMDQKTLIPKKCQFYARPITPYPILDRSVTEITVQNSEPVHEVNSSVIQHKRVSPMRTSSLDQTQKPKEVSTFSPPNPSLHTKGAREKSPPQSSSLLLTKPRKSQPHPQSCGPRNLKANQNFLIERDEYKEIIPPGGILGYRPIIRFQEKGIAPVKVMSVNLMNNLLLSKEKFSNIQRILDTFLSGDKK